MDTIRGSGIVVTEPRAVNNIRAVELDTSGQLTITQGDREALTIEAEDNLMPLLTSELINGTLVLGVQRDHSISATKPIRYTLAVKDLAAISVNGSGSLAMSDFATQHPLHIVGSGSGSLEFASIKSGDPTILLSGSGSLNINSLETGKAALQVNGSGNIELATLQAHSLAARLNGHGSLRVSGQTNNQKVNLMGSGRYEAEGLTSRAASVSATGSGSAVVQVSDSLDASVMGSGSISYIGSPTVSQRRVGSGKIQRRG